MSNSSKIPTSIQRVPIETVNAIRAEAAASRMSVSDVIRDTLTRQLDTGALPPGVRSRPQCGERDDLTVRLDEDTRKRIEDAATYHSHSPAQWRVLALMAAYQPEAASEAASPPAAEAPAHADG